MFIETKGAKLALSTRTMWQPVVTPVSVKVPRSSGQQLTPLRLAERKLALRLDRAVQQQRYGFQKTARGKGLIEKRLVFPEALPLLK